MRFNQTNKGNSIIVILIVIVILAIGGVFYYKGAKTQKEALEAPLPPPPADTTIPSPPTDSPIVEIGVEDEMLTAPSGDTIIEAHPLKEFAITGQNFAFSVKEIRVKKGDFVRINFTSGDVLHDWVVDEFNAKTDQVSTGGTTSVDFVADKAGTFEFYCSVGSHRQMGMVGKFIVE